jgi:hypothetical protein
MRRGHYEIATDVPADAASLLPSRIWPGAS